MSEALGERWPSPPLPLTQPAAEQALAMLARQPVLLAVTLEGVVADTQVEITVSKTVEEAGLRPPQFWWEVTKLGRDAAGQLTREKRWALGLRPYATAAAAYEAAVATITRTVSSRP